MKTLKELASFLSAELRGNPDTIVRGVSGIENAKEGDVTFIASQKYLEAAKSTAASALIVPEEIPGCRTAMLIVKNPYLAFARTVELFMTRKREPHGVDEKAVIGNNVSLGKGISVYPYAVIDNDVKIGDRVVIYPGVYIGRGTVIGNDTLIYSNTSVREETVIGERVIIHSNTTVGGDGFGYVQDNGRHIKIPQVGNVVIEDDVEIGSNVSIDRATLGSTFVRKGTKIDNHVQVAHNVDVGENCILVSQVGISGSCKIGNNVILAGQVGIADHVRLGDNVIVGAKSGVGKDVPANSMISGAPAYEHRKWRRTQACLPKLSDAFRTIRELQKRIEHLEKKTESR